MKLLTFNEDKWKGVAHSNSGGTRTRLRNLLMKSRTTQKALETVAVPPGFCTSCSSFPRWTQMAHTACQLPPSHPAVMTKERISAILQSPEGPHLLMPVRRWLSCWTLGEVSKDAAPNDIYEPDSSQTALQRMFHLWNFLVYKREYRLQCVCLRTCGGQRTASAYWSLPSAFFEMGSVTCWEH